MAKKLALSVNEKLEAATVKKGRCWNEQAVVSAGGDKYSTIELSWITYDDWYDSRGGRQEVRVWLPDPDNVGYLKKAVVFTEEGKTVADGPRVSDCRTVYKTNYDNAWAIDHAIALTAIAEKNLCYEDFGLLMQMVSAVESQLGL